MRGIDLDPEKERSHTHITDRIFYNEADDEEVRVENKTKLYKTVLKMSYIILAFQLVLMCVYIYLISNILVIYQDCNAIALGKYPILNR